MQENDLIKEKEQEVSDDEMNEIISHNPKIDYQGNEITLKSFKDAAIVTFLVSCCLVVLKLVIGRAFDWGILIVYFLLSGLFYYLDGKRSENKPGKITGIIMTALAILIMMGYLVTIKG